MIFAIFLKWREKYPPHFLLAKEFVKFCFVGLTNLLIDYTIYFLLTRVFSVYYILAAVLSFLVAVSWSFFVNRRWTFRHQSKDVGAQYVKFFAANLISIIINIYLLYLLVEYAHVYDLIGKLIATIITSFINFGLNRFWVFSVKK